MSGYWKLKISLFYDCKTYSFDTESYADVENKNVDCFWWTEGNGNCDCNRSLYIKRECDKDFPEMECGDTIDLVNIEPLFEYSKEPVFENGEWKEAVK